MVNRIKNWPVALAEVIDHHRTLPLSWGVSDCFVFPMDCVRSVTGDDPWKDQRDYTTEMGAAKRLISLGFKDVGDAFAAKLTEIPPALMGRGDLGTIKQGESVCGVVCVGRQVIGKAANGGLTFAPRSLAVRAFRVGA